MNAVQKIEEKLKAGKYESLRSALSAISRTKHMRMVERQRLTELARKFFTAPPELMNGDGVAPDPLGHENGEIDKIMQQVLRAALKYGWTVQDTFKKIEKATDKYLKD